MFEKKKKKTNKRFKSKVQSPNFWSTFVDFHPFLFLVYHLFWGGGFGVLGRHFAFWCAVSIPLLQFSSQLPSFHPTFAVLHTGFPVCIAVSQFSSYFAVCIAVSRFTVHCITVNSQFVSQFAMHCITVNSQFASQLSSQFAMHYIAVESQASW